MDEGEGNGDVEISFEAFAAELYPALANGYVTMSQIEGGNGGYFMGNGGDIWAGGEEPVTPNTQTPPTPMVPVPQAQPYTWKETWPRIYGWPGTGSEEIVTNIPNGGVVVELPLPVIATPRGTMTNGGGPSTPRRSRRKGQAKAAELGLATAPKSPRRAGGVQGKTANTPPRNRRKAKKDVEVEVGGEPAVDETVMEEKTAVEEKTATETVTEERMTTSDDDAEGEPDIPDDGPAANTRSRKEIILTL